MTWLFWVGFVARSIGCCVARRAEVWDLPHSPCGADWQSPYHKDATAFLYDRSSLLPWSGANRKLQGSLGAGPTKGQGLLEHTSPERGCIVDVVINKTLQLHDIEKTTFSDFLRWWTCQGLPKLLDRSRTSVL